MLEVFNHLTILRTAYHERVPVELIKFPWTLLPKRIIRGSGGIPYFRQFFKLPSGYYVPWLKDNVELHAFAYQLKIAKTMTFMNSRVHHINMGLHAEQFDLSEDGQTLTVWDPAGMRLDFETEDPEFYQNLIYGTEAEFPGIVAAEAAFTSDDFDDLAGSSPINIEFDTVEYLSRYLTIPGSVVDPKVPLLAGHTGVAKSALVKDAARTHDMRLVDLRCGFIDKSDIEGFVKIIEEEGVFEQAPMKELITATDPFLAQIRGFFEDLGVAWKGKKKLSDDEITVVLKAQMDRRRDDAGPSADPADFPIWDDLSDSEKEVVFSNEREVLENLFKLTKTPIIFFDEINRAPKSVRNAFTNILNKKKFLTYEMHEAKVIAAANVPINSPNLAVDFEEMEGFYQLDDGQIEDKAILERFITINLDPIDPAITEDWLDWAENKRVVESAKADLSRPNGFVKVETAKPFEREVLKFLKQNPKRAYDMSSLKEVQGGLVSADPNDATDATGDFRPPADKTDVKITTFRGWEQMNDYLAAKKKQATPSGSLAPQGKVTLHKTMILNILGETETAIKFMEWLEVETNATIKTDRDAGWEGYTITEGTKTNVLSDTLDEGFLAGIPVLLAGATSTGKTSRVQQWADDNDAEIFTMDLSLTDRVQLRGVPDMQKLSENILQGLTPTSRDSMFAASLSERLDNAPGLPDSLTHYLPRGDLIRDIRRALERGKDIVLFYDEVNRASSTVMSSVFEAVSDNRFMGVEFPPGRIKVVAACNIGSVSGDADGEDSYGSVTMLDPAFTARFMMARKDIVDESDYRAFLKWAERTDKKSGVRKLDATLTRVIEELGPEGYIKMLALVNKRTIETNVPSTRSLSSFSKFLTGSSMAQSYMRGFMIHLQGGYEKMDAKAIFAQTQKSNWVGNMPDSEIIMAAGAGRGKKRTVNGVSLNDTFEELSRGVGQGLPQTITLVQAKTILSSYEIALQTKRKEIWRKYMGDFKVTDELAKLYDQFEAVRLLTIPELVNTGLIPEYLGQVLGADLSNISADLTRAVTACVEILDGHRNNYSSQDIVSVFEAFANVLINIQTKTSFIEGLHKHPQAEVILKSIPVAKKHVTALNVSFPLSKIS